MAKDPRGLRIAAPLISVGVQLAEMLVAMTVYCLIVAWIVHHYDIPTVNLGAEATLLNGIILGLLYGFRNRAAYDRWWEGRRLWGQLVNDSRNLAIKIAAVVPRAEIERAADERAIADRATAERTASGGRIGDLIAGFADALRLHLRKIPVQAKDLPGLPSDRVPAHVPMDLTQRIIALVAAWRRDNIIDGETLIVLDPHLRAFLDVCGGCERINNTPLPASYKGMLRAGLALNVLVAPWFCMNQTDLGLWALPVLLLTAYFLLGVELIDSAIEQPFGTDRDDLDLDRYCRTIRDGVATALPSTTTRVETVGATSTTILVLK